MYISNYTNLNVRIIPSCNGMFTFPRFIGGGTGDGSRDKNAFQGILMRQRVDVRDWVLSAMKSSGVAMGRAGAFLGLHPSLVRVVCLYAAACVTPDAAGDDGEVGGMGRERMASVFVMTPILPTEVAKIVRAVDWVREL